MNKKLTILLLLFSTMLSSQQTIDAFSFANFEKYKSGNESLKSKNNEVVFLGNSITEGWVNVMPDFFAKNNYIGRGISGQTSTQLLLRFRKDVVELKPKLVIINISFLLMKYFGCKTLVCLIEIASREVLVWT